MAETNIKFLKENNLYEAHKNFMRMAEGYGYAAPIEEAGEEDVDNQQDNNPMGGGDGNAAPDMNTPMGGEGQPDMSQPMGGGGDNAAPDMNAPMGGDGQDGNDPSNMPPSMGGEDSGAPDMGMTPPPMGAEGSDGSGDEDVIDVDDVVKAQEKTNDKVNDVGRDLGTVDKRIEKLLGALETMQGVIDRNNEEIADLKQEFEKRNPTQTEKLNLRSLDSYPFNVRPTDYWRQKGIDSNYQAYADNYEPTTQEYTITNDDVDNINGNIDKTFNIPDDDIQDINKIFNI